MGQAQECSRIIYVKEELGVLKLMLVAATSLLSVSHFLKTLGISLYVCASLIQEVEKGKKKDKSKSKKVKVGAGKFPLSFPDLNLSPQLIHF